MPLQHVRIIGSGLIGTSIGLGLVQRGVLVTMSDIDFYSEKLAQDLVKSGSSEIPDLILLATPISSIRPILEGEKTAPVKFGFMDISSVKTKVKVEVKASGISLANFLPTHPMAGREVGGAESARADLFQGRPWIVDPEGVENELLSAGMELIQILGAHPVEMKSTEHDQAVALVSHLPQMVASLLAGQLNDARSDWLELAGAGLRDTVRIAGSDPKLWREIISSNSEAIKPLLEKLIADSSALLTDLRSEELIAQVISRGNEGNAKIPGKHGGKAREYTYLPIVIEDKPGQLAALFNECAVAQVNVEDLSIEHSPGQFTGLITLALSESDCRKLSDHLRSKGWSVHTARTSLQ
jgi:prephenate dehydrogenase